MSNPQLILASASPRRRELLEQIGIRYQVQTADIDESPLPAEEPFALVQRLAKEKAQSIWEASDKSLPVLGADTLGIVDGQLLVKPDNFLSARQMLLSMSGRAHTIYSAVALYHQNACELAVSESKVWFRMMTEAEIEAYWKQGEPRDKAGAYAIQGMGAIFAERLEGSYSGVMGLPLFETAQLLAKAGIRIL
ncbi:nucleoside triphosphate pyrophosphatase [uncultured Thiothrix sp.]|jgi:septum formation protein|uniref:Maf family protein n=1 Tax=uncultured Thiothrix sp. TaxID=223185 RepID=UPI00260DEA01|nr:nucleoside triphosphate pyrophosphatase [uncultured Thiothrix sp.]HMT92841.1 nucleoside triphosphate pyrophosphatase [Thiolinea sp.]